MRVTSFRRRALLAVAALGLVASTGCIGSFQLTRKVYNWNKTVSPDKFVQELVFLGLNIVPVYSIATLADAVFANSVEFWTGTNPVASARTQSINETAIREDEIITTVGVNVALNLFSGGRRIARVLEAKHARREAEYRITETELKIVGEVRQALLDLQTAQQVLILQRGAAEFVEKNRDLVVKEYDAGRAMLVRLNQAQRDLVQAQGQLAQARVALQRSWAALRAATGVNLTELNEAPENESTME